MNHQHALLFTRSRPFRPRVESAARWLALALVAAGGPIAAQAQLFTYNFSDVVAGTTAAPVFTSAGGVANNLTFSNFSSAGVGGTTGAGAANRFSMTGWDLGATLGSDTFTGAINLGKYYEFTITPQAGYALDLNQITFVLQHSSTGIRQYSVRSSMDTFGSNLGASISPANANLSVVPTDVFQATEAATTAQQGSTITLGSAFDAITAPVTFRFYGFNARATGGTFSLDDVTSFGSVAFLAARNVTWAPSASLKNWNTTDPNWQLPGPTATAFQALDNVNFTDAGLANGSTVTVDPGGVSPSQINVSNTSGNYTLQGGAVTTTGALTKTGAGTLTLSAVVNAGAYVINAGTVTTTADERLADTAAVTVAAGATLNLAGHNETVGSLNLTGGTISTGAGTLTFGGLSSAGGASSTSTITGLLSPGATSSTIVVNDGTAPVDLLISATLTNGATSTSRITFSGSGTKQLDADNSLFSGGISLAGGTLILGQKNALGTSQFFWNGGTLQAGVSLTGTSAIANSVSMGGDVAVSGTNDLELAGTFVFFSGNTTNKILAINNPNTIISGLISGTGNAGRFTKSGPGKLTLTNSNTNSSQLGVNQGVIDALNDLAFGTANVSLTPASPDTATINFKTATPAIGALTSSGTGTAKIVLGDATAAPAAELSIGTGNLNTTYSGSIENAPGSVGKITKVGTGQQILAGANTFTGETKVTAGTLVISGTLNGTTRVLVDTGTLGGNGTITLPASGQIALANGATLAPGNGPGSTGILKVNGSVIAGVPGTIEFAAGTSLAVELTAAVVGGSAANPGTIDQLVLTGDLNLNAATLSGSLLTNFATSIGDIFFLVINDGNDAIGGTFAGLAQGSTITLSGAGGSVDFKISYTGDSGTNAFTAVGGNDLVLQTVTVPEPATLSVLVLGATGLLGLRRMRTSGGKKSDETRSRACS